MSKLLFTGSEWDEATIQRCHDACAEIAQEELGLDTYPNQFEIVDSERMLDAYASIGLPLMYKHWSFGKEFLHNEKNYRAGKQGLAYELVINSSPCINYLMDDNSATMQCLVIAHAAFGHNHFFKNNYLFQEWTDATSIVDYLGFARDYIRKCEEKYGEDEVEKLLDSCHALQLHGIDKYKRPVKPSAEEEKKRQEERERYLQQQVNVLWNPSGESLSVTSEPRKFPPEPVENLLKFFEKNSPVLQTWQREIIRIVRMVSQYLYPQRQTKVMNEGFACWTHFYIMNRLYDKGLISDGAMIEFLSSHAGVIYQPGYDQPWYSGINPYTLGFKMFQDIERICRNPTEEDKDWFPQIAGQKDSYIDIIKEAAAEYRDESFIRQFLSPKVIRDLKLFRVEDEDADFYKVTCIHNALGYRKIRKALANSYDINNIIPDIQIIDANMDTDRHLEIHHYSTQNRSLVDKDAMECLKHIKTLWGFEPYIISFDSNGDPIDEFILL